LQYTALPVGQGGLLVQGTGQLNTKGTHLPAPGQVPPTASRVVPGQAHRWSRLVTTGGNGLLTGDTLFTRWQPI
jgi:hypothetical protein